jgi:hypothetical protein
MMDINLASIAGNLRTAKRHETEANTRPAAAKRGGLGRLFSALSIMLVVVGL